MPTPHTLGVTLEAALVMGATYGLVRFTYAASNHLGASLHWKKWTYGGWMAFLIIGAGLFLGDGWASSHLRNCDEEFPAGKVMARNDPNYVIVQSCHDQNRSERQGRMLAVILVLGITSVSGVYRGRQEAKL